MTDQRRNGFCTHCQKRVEVFRPGTNHPLHLLLTLVTLGLWLIPWILHSVKIGGWRCSQCGSKAVNLSSSMGRTPAPRMKRCPFCAEEIRFEAVKCRYCGSELTDSNPTSISSPYANFAVVNQAPPRSRSHGGEFGIAVLETMLDSTMQAVSWVLH